MTPTITFTVSSPQLTLCTTKCRALRAQHLYNVLTSSTYCIVIFKNKNMIEMTNIC